MIRIRRSAWPVLVTLLLHGGGLSARAEYIRPDEVQVSTPSYHPSISHFNGPFGTYDYTVSWGGIPAASVSVSIEPDGLDYRVVATAKTYSGIDLFYKLRYRAEGIVSGINYAPVRAVIEQRENSRQKFTKIDFLENGEVRSIRTTNKGADEGVVEELRFNPNNTMFDPFSGAFLARSLDWKVGQERQFDTFNGKSRYLITLKAVDQIKMRVNDEPRDVWVISPKVVNLTDTTPSKKLRRALIYVTADEKREVLKIKSEVFIGSVTTQLEAFTPSAAQPGVRMAAQRAERIFID